ncbi:MAG: response regulator transcription factor [Verrucomicrobiaceae bacterium]|nr:MAG: response regulator transcription factor [Verrucomicrobiaceae bacterium]
MRLLLVEDSQRLNATMCQALSRLGHAVDSAENGEDGEFMARHNEYDVIVLDRMLPAKDGLSVLRDLRRDGIDTPVLVLTALDSTDDKVKGLTDGADDYLTKPFALVELVARLEALSRRRYGQADSRRTIGPLEIDISRKSVSRDGAEVALTAREFSLLEILARRPGHILSREQIEERLYSEADGPQSNAVDAAIYSLRRKLCPPGTPPLIHTRRGLGYVLEAS